MNCSKRLPHRGLSAWGMPLASLLVSGCLSAPFMPPNGVVAVTKAPLSTEGNWKAGLKRGVASSQSVLGLYAWGDCSITAAAQNGGLARVDYLDYKYLNVIGIWQKVEVFVYGE